MYFKEWLITEETHKFSSTQINLPPSIIKQIKKWSKTHIANKNIFEEENTNEICNHVTVLYGFHTDNPKDIRKIISNFPKFKIKLGKVSKFQLDTHDVIKIEIHGKKLFELNKELSKLEHTNKFDFNPHCTIAYVKKDSCNNLINNTDFENIEIDVDNIVFSSKERVKTKIYLCGSNMAPAP